MRAHQDDRRTRAARRDGLQPVREALLALRLGKVPHEQVDGTIREEELVRRIVRFLQHHVLVPNRIHTHTHTHTHHIHRATYLTSKVPCADGDLWRRLHALLAAHIA